jgi:hypothetical protein
MTDELCEFDLRALCDAASPLSRTSGAVPGVATHLGEIEVG